MSAQLLEFDEAAHRYTLAGRDVPSVTRILDDNHFYDFTFVSAEDLEYKRRVGVHVHHASALYDRGTLDFSTVGEHIVGYVQAYMAFRAEWMGTITAIEQRCYCPAADFAGTLDRGFKMGGIRGSTIGIFDVKTGQPCAANKLQTAAYAVAHYGAQILGRSRELYRFSLHLSPTGRYRIYVHKDLAGDFRTFQSCRQLYEWRRANAS